MTSITNGNSNIDSNVSIHQKEIDRLHEEHHEHDRRLRKKHEMLRKKTTTRVQESFVFFHYFDDIFAEFAVVFD